jgi:hypothetical protein
LCRVVGFRLGVRRVMPLTLTIRGNNAGILEVFRFEFLARRSNEREIF